MCVSFTSHALTSTLHRAIEQGLSLAVLILLPLAGCDLPRDPEDTLQQARGGTLRVGVIHDKPWTLEASGGEPARGVEVELVNRLASELDATVVWESGGDSRLMQKLEEFELDLVVGGIVQNTAWEKRVGLTSPYFIEQPKSAADGKASRIHRKERKHVFAIPPGENGWLVHLDRFLEDNRSLVPQLLEKYDQRLSQGDASQ